MTIKQLPEVVNGRVKASVEKVDASLIDLAPTGNALVATTEGLKVDLSSYATTTDVSNAIVAAQLANGEVDLSGYATKAELAAYPKTVDVITSLGEQAEGLESQIALKADVSALSAYATKADLEDYSRFEDVSTALFGMESVLNERVANLVSTTTLEAYKTEVTTTISEKASIEDVEAMGNEFNEALRSITPVQTAVEGVTTPKVNSIPLYTLSNDGDYVLCTPDSWLKIGNFYVPAYTGSTVGITG